MNMVVTYGIIFVILLALELAYFKIADRFNIIDKPNERSSHSTNVLRGGGIIFLLSLWIWSAFYGFQYPFFLLAVTLIAGVSFIDDIRSLPDSVRLVAQFIAMAMMFGQLDILHWDMWWIVIVALIVCVGASNVINFMDGVNGITGVYAMASLVPLALLNNTICFVNQSLIYVVMIADVIFCLFNFRPKGKAKCFAGDVGSIGIAYILLFMIGLLVLTTGDVTYLIFLLVYGVDGCLTICHRILLHENLGEAHRKHAYQLMANELKIGHMKVSSFYAILQLVISLGFIYICPNTAVCHWLYIVGAILILVVGYIMFKKKYYHLHEKYLASLKKNITMIQIDKKLIRELFDQALVNPRLRQNYDLRTSKEDGNQCMLNALMPGTVVLVHRHPQSNENVILLSGKLIEILYDKDGNETERIHLDPTVGNFGCVVPAGAWHTVEVLEPSVIYEAKDGKYGEDGSETLDEYQAKQNLTSSETPAFSNSLGGLKKNIEYLIGMERQSGSMDSISPLYVSRMLNVPLGDVKACMKNIDL